MVTHYALYPARIRTRDRSQPDTVHCLGVSAQRRLSTAVRRWPVGLPSRSLITLRDHGAAVAELRSNRNGRLKHALYGPGCGDCAGGRDMQCLPICTLGFLFLRRTWLPACAGVRYWPRHLPSCCWSGRATRASDGLIWPKDGYASIAYAATAPMRLSSPGLRPFLARQQSLSAAVLRCAPARRRVRRRSPSACRSPSRPRWSQASRSPSA